MGLIVDLFAGGGGASLGIERALFRPVDIAINHDPEAVALHQRNHPYTRHYVEDVWEVDPLQATGGQPVDLLWASPDCKHFSKARGGAPVSKRVRSLAWVVIKWAGKVRPAVILMENVEEFVTWGPLIMKRGEDGKPLHDVDGRPVMIPDPKRKGQIFRAWVKHLQRLGYAVEYRELVAADHGDPTTRKRLKIVARCDGRPIVWPAPTHADPKLPAERRQGRKPWRSAASIIDWSIPCPSIFLTREQGRALGVNRPLADKTMARIAKGVRRYVLDNPRPFIVPVTHGGAPRAHDSRDPLRTITTASRGELALITPFLGSHYGPDGGRDRPPESPVPAITTRGTQNQVVAPILQKYHGAKRDSDARGLVPSEPVPTTDTSNRVSLVAAFLAQHNDGPRPGAPGRPASDPVSTVTATGSQQAIVAAHIQRDCGRSVGCQAGDPAPAVTAGGGGKVAVVATHISRLRGSNKTASGGAPDSPIGTITAGGQHESVVAAFLQEYYSTGGQYADPAQPMPTIVTKARHAPVTVTLKGQPYAIVDIGMRMFSPRELYRAQGFPDSYVIDAGIGGKWLTKSAQIRMCGNSVCPGVACALVTANAGHLRRLVGEAAE